MRVCIYTAIYGGYDDLKEVPRQSLDCDCLCFTDEPGLGANAHGWQVKLMSSRLTAGMHPRMQAKYPRILNQDFFAPPPRNLMGRVLQHARRLAHYDYTIWIDGGIRILSPTFAEEMIGHIGKYGWAMFVHPVRDCIYAECEACWYFPKYADQPLREQVEFYRAQGYPAHNGLMATGLIARDMRDTRLHKINRDWWRENVRWSYQDQLSLPYVLWSNGYWYDEVRLNLWGNHLFDMTPHRSEL